MRAHNCDQECPCGHWKPGTASRYRVVEPRKGRITLDVYDGTNDHDANAYKNYESED